jgi:hypothetical protein
MASAQTLSPSSQAYWEQKFDNFVLFALSDGPASLMQPLFEFVSVQSKLVELPVAKPDVMRFLALLSMIRQTNPAAV